jgi:hypothetical protein
MGGIDIGAVLANWLLFGLVAGAIGQLKGNATAGVILGLFLGPVGILIIAVIESSKTKLDMIEARPATAGWYPDPLGRTNSRWFDGIRWTQHVGRIDPDGTRLQYEDPV